MTRAAQAIIDLKALQHNLRCAREAAPSSRVMTVIKANGYGHGLLRVARALTDADAFAVACIEEAMELREAGIRTPIVLLEGFFDTAELLLASKHELEPVVHHPNQIEMLKFTQLARPVRVWLKIDSGMHRLGFAPAVAADAWRRLRECAAVAARIGLVTHLANADDRSDSYTLMQLETFRSALPELEAERSIANSAGILGWPQTHAEWVRPGIMLYGASPFGAGHGEEEGLLPVMTLATRLIAVNPFRKGDAVGYGGSWVCPEDMIVGVAAIGYGDGYPRHAATGTPVLVNGVRVPLVGRVCMDMITVDLRGVPDAQVGDPVVLWGGGLPVEEVAQYSSTIAYELLCGITQRVKLVEA